MHEFSDDEHIPGRFGPNATVEVYAHEVGPVHTEYSPKHDGDPDPGEIVWTWVPYEEHDGRGKDRPVLVVAREHGHHDTLLAVRLSSKPHEHNPHWVELGTGPWDHSGRDSWVDLERIMRIHHHGIRREACALDHARFNLVSDHLKRRFGWT